MILTRWQLPVEPAEHAPDVLGRKGLLGRDPATRLALCSVHRLLRLPDGARPGGPVCPQTAVVGCSNLGNVDTVAQVARQVAEEGGRAVSVLAAPNASSNVVATTVALWFRFGGPNLMVCSGSRAGLHGLWLAGLLLRARRARRVVLVGVEPADPTAVHLYGPDLRAAAACVELAADGPGLPVTVAGGGGGWPARPLVTTRAGTVDPTQRWGDCYGARGVVAVATAAELAAEHGWAAIGDARQVLVGAA